MTDALHESALNLIAASTTSTASASGGGSLLQSFFVQRHYASDGASGGVEVLGTILIWVLVLMSIACWTIAIRAMRSHAVASIAPQAFIDEMLGLVRSGDRAYAQAYVREQCASSGCPDIAQSVQAGLARLDSGAPEDVALAATEQAAEARTLARLRSIEPLNVLGGVSPMLGLFGTVYGMILAFNDIVEAGGTPDAVSLAAGIGTALTTTFWGLIVAVPALTTHALLRTRIEARTLDGLEHACSIVTAAAHAKSDSGVHT